MRYVVTSVLRIASCVGALSLSSIAYAGEHECDVPEVSGTETANAGLQCLLAKFDALASENERLKQRLARIVGQNGLETEIPDGAVVAFDRPNGCPVGWQADISAAAGRTIVGVDGDQYRLPYEQGQPVYVTGGSETHQLKLVEMPAHGHRISTDHSRDDIHDGLAGFSHQNGFDRGILTDFSNIPNEPAWTTVLPNVLEKTGGLPDGTTQPHNNMPPFIALYYCKKE